MNISVKLESIVAPAEKGTIKRLFILCSLDTQTRYEIFNIM